MEKLTEYERRRLENIKRNEEMLAALKVHSAANQLSVAIKRQRDEKKSYRVSSVKKPKVEAPVVIRRSLRTRGMPPDSDAVIDDDLAKSELIKPSVESLKKASLRHLGPITMTDAYSGEGSYGPLVEKLISVPKQLGDAVKGTIDLARWRLEEENVARVLPGRIFTVKFLPCTCANIVVVGNKVGNVSFWDVNCGDDEEDGIYLYQPHSAPVSGISVQPFSLQKIITSSYDGVIRRMDAEKEIFDLLYSSDEAIFSLSQGLDNSKCIYFGEGPGILNIWDEREGKSLSSWNLHEDRINSIDFNPQNPNMMVTSSTDGTARVWDLRSTRSRKPTSLKTINHERAVHSAYFSPSGHLIATTSSNNTVGIIGGTSFDDISMISHNNETGRWISSFKAIWGWDDSHVLIGNMRRGVDVLSTAKSKTISTLRSEHMTAIPCRFAAHPCKVGTLAGATSGGQVYIWTYS